MSRRPIAYPSVIIASILQIAMTGNSLARTDSPNLEQSSMLFEETVGASNPDPAREVIAKGRFTSLYEPSGIVPLPDGRFLVVEDESARALRLISGSDGNPLTGFDVESSVAMPEKMQERWKLAMLDDLEGAAHDRSHRLYVVSSHDDQLPYWVSRRQKLLRFSIRDGRIADVSVKLTLRRDLLASYPRLADAVRPNRKTKESGLSVEALAYDRRREVLLIGLRSPLVNDKAIIVRLLNPDAYLGEGVEPEFEPDLWTLDLDKGGLRAMAYDDRSDQLLLVSRREHRGNAAFKLWRLPADRTGKVRRIQVGKKDDLFDRVEGLTPFERPGASDSGVLFVRDNGKNRSRRGADWFIISRSTLGIDAGAP
ncbi:MAG: hypothetical protein HKN42_13975 [Granulosicoccus sp.]|nr:hypothetical protein [Granulosicoccus sp.]